MHHTAIRNFCIIAHIDHGKSTLADRFLEFTHTISKREMKDQILDQMDIERERGITIKLQPVRMRFHLHEAEYQLNLIDTPGHVDFSYEVSRSLAAVEGALLLVDATQGIQAQTLANLYLALDQNLVIVPAINKIDLPGARTIETRDELAQLLGCEPHEICAVSAKTGEGVAELLSEIVRRVPPPSTHVETPFRGLIFDSLYDEFRGVVAYVRVIDGILEAQQHITFKATGAKAPSLEVGYFSPKQTPSQRLQAGDIGYIVTGLKNVLDCRVGDTIIQTGSPSTDALHGYQEVRPMVFAGIFSKEGDDTKKLRDAVERLKLNDAAFSFEPEHSTALGLGFRCGFLGMLHMEIVTERLHREYGLSLIVSTPSVAYRCILPNRDERTIHSPLELTDTFAMADIQEPWMRLDILCPVEYLGAMLQFVSERRGVYLTTEYLQGTRNTSQRVILHFEIPLSVLLVDFYDRLKSISSGFASMNYDFLAYQSSDVVRLDVFVAESLVEELTSIVTRDESYYVARHIVESLKKMLPRQLFEVKIQAAIGSKVIAAERIPPLRKDVTAKLYGGDATRKMKLLEKQKKGKKRMRAIGRIDIPQEAYLTLLRRTP